MSNTGVRTRITLQSLERRFEVTRAVIPCAGAGTRMRGVTGAAPKELLPVGGMPALEHVLRELATSGVTHAMIVVSPGKDAIVAWAQSHAGKEGFPKNIGFVEQKTPLGVADAISRTRDFANGEPLSVALPSHIFRGELPAMAQVVNTYRKMVQTSIAIIEARAAIAATRAAVPVYEGTLSGEEFTIERIPDVGSMGNTVLPGTIPYTGAGRYVLSPDAFQAIDAVLRGATAGAEIDLVPVLQRMLARGQVAGRLVRGRYADLSIPSGYDEAKRAFAAV